MAELSKEEALEAAQQAIREHRETIEAEQKADREKARIESIETRASLRLIAVKNFPILFPFMDFDPLEARRVGWDASLTPEQRAMLRRMTNAL